MLQTVQPKVRPSRAKIASAQWKPREQPLTLDQVTLISRARTRDNLPWSVIAIKFGRSVTQLKKAWSLHRPQWANDARLPADVRAYHAARCNLVEANDEKPSPRVIDLDAVYVAACNAAGGFPVRNLPSTVEDYVAKQRAQRYVDAAAR